ncbi:MAG: CHASE2 domain-containing protein [Pseudomonadota bacterium]|nr:MAG: CHASE2 domain-containing protein [Pseudomonadota bacterium]
MKTARFYQKDWFLALVIGVVFSAFALSGSPLLSRLEVLVYDTGVKLTQRTPGAAAQIALVEIDDPSIQQIGRWPWPRSVIADLLDLLANAEPKALGLQIIFTEPQLDPGLIHIRKLRSHVAATAWPKPAQREAQSLETMLAQAEAELDSDARLAGTLADLRNVYLGMFFKIGNPLGRPDQLLPGYVQNSRISRIIAKPEARASVLATQAVYAPLEQFGSRVAGIGHLQLFKDSAGGVRSEALVLEHHGEYYPSLALLLAARSLNLGPRDIEVELGEGVRVGKLYIKTSPRMEMYTGFYSRSGPDPVFATYSLADVIAGNIRPEAFKGKIVLIGPTASGLGNKHATPIRADMSEPEFAAHVMASILNQDFYTRPNWAVAAEAALLVMVTVYLMLALPSLGAKLAAALSLLLLGGLMGGELFLLVSEKTWVQAASPSLLLFVGHVLITSKRFFLTERLKVAAETDSAYTNRQLGLTFQSQGQLDQALDKFRRLPVDDSVMELIYNLALDFERKRQFSKAAAAYDYVLQHNAKFRDTVERKKRAQQMENAVMLGSRAMTAGGTLMLDGVDQKPTLGRYEIEKELGKGAMGTVYLGRDPKINRVVAIKTLSLQEFDEPELPVIKERFFREAETAGRLNHPNIVTIYDAGEEHDLAYIAMEYLQGKDLTHYIRRGPLPIAWAVQTAARVADALDYAHRMDVVHRDIKPANIMHNEADKTIKVTDFGIARITAASRTKTGVVLGTPSYMSPEQLVGKHVDGRSDLFSLGVMLYELLTGKQPFTAESMAALMYQIANVPQVDPRELRGDIPDCLVAVVNRLLQKSPDARYAQGAEVSADLRRCVPEPTATGVSA